MYSFVQPLKGGTEGAERGHLTGGNKGKREGRGLETGASWSREGEDEKGRPFGPHPSSKEARGRDHRALCQEWRRP